MSVGRFLGCLAVAICFGIDGLCFHNEGFFNPGFLIMLVLSIPSLFIGGVNE